MDLTDAERKVSRYIQLQPSVAAEEVARVCNLKTATVRNSIKKLKDRGVLQRAILFDASKAGLTRYRVLLALKGSVSEKQEIIREFLRFSAVEVVNQLQGEFQVVVQIAATDIADVQRVLREVLEKKSGVVQKFTVVPMLSLELLGSKFLADISADLPTVGWSHELAQFKVTEDDNRILKVVRESPGISLSMLTKATGIAQSTVSYKLNKMREAGIIAAEFYMVTPQSYGLQVFNVYVRSADVSEGFRKKFRSFCVEHGLIDVLMQFLGEWQFVLSVVAENHSQVVAVCGDIEARFKEQVSRLTVYPHIQVFNNDNFSLL